MHYQVNELLIVLNSQHGTWIPNLEPAVVLPCLGKIERYRIRANHMNVFRKAPPLRVNRRYGLSSHDEPGGKGHRSRPRHTTVFLPGSPIPETGIYEVIHDKGHRVAHEAVLHGKDLFPTCDQCGEKVRFRLVRTAPYIFDDEDFIQEP